MAAPGEVPSTPPGPPGPGVPNIGQIPLPPGMTIDQFMKLQGQLIDIAICVAVALGIVFWDYLVLIRSEYQLYKATNTKVWQTPATYAFILLRYSAFIATLPSLWFTSLQSDHCQAAVVISQIGALLVVASAGIIFCYRVTAIWNGSKLIYAIVGFSWAVMMACWIAVATKYHAITGPPTPFGSNCQMQPIVSWAPISFASSVFFDIVILALTIMKIRADHILQSQIGRELYKDSLLYFIATAVTNITVLSIQSLGSEHDMIKPTAVPFSTIITVAMAQRVFLHLKLYHQRQERGDVSTLPSSGTFTTSQTYSNIYGRTPAQQKIGSGPSRRSDTEEAAGFEIKPLGYPPQGGSARVYFSPETSTDASSARSP